MHFVFYWGSKMEKVMREMVMKPVVKGGYDFPNVERFLEVQWWLVHFKTFSAGGKAAALMRYLIGWSLLKWGWCKRFLRRLMSIVSSVHYLRIKKLFDANQLGELGRRAVKKEVLWKWLSGRELITNIVGLGP